MSKHTDGPWQVSKLHNEHTGEWFLRVVGGFGPRPCLVDICRLADHAEYIDPVNEANARLIAKAPEMLAMLGRVEWVQQSNEMAGWEECPCCSGIRDDGGHKDNCELAALIREVEGGE